MNRNGRHTVSTAEQRNAKQSRLGFRRAYYKFTTYHHFLRGYTRIQAAGRLGTSLLLGCLRGQIAADMGLHTWEKDDSFNIGIYVGFYLIELTVDECCPILVLALITLRPDFSQHILC
jgi:hypothetical protein